MASAFGADLPEWNIKVFATDVATGREAHALLQLIGIAEAKSIEAMQARNASARME